MTKHRRATTLSLSLPNRAHPDNAGLPVLHKRRARKWFHALKRAEARLRLEYQPTHFGNACRPDEACGCGCEPWDWRAFYALNATGTERRLQRKVLRAARNVTVAGGTLHYLDKEFADECAADFERMRQGLKPIGFISREDAELLDRGECPHCGLPVWMPAVAPFLERPCARYHAKPQEWGLNAEEYAKLEALVKNPPEPTAALREALCKLAPECLDPKNCGGPHPDGGCMYVEEVS